MENLEIKARASMHICLQTSTDLLQLSPYQHGVQRDTHNHHRFTQSNNELVPRVYEVTLHTDKDPGAHARSVCKARCRA